MPPMTVPQEKYAQELDRLLHYIVAALGDLNDSRLIFKGGTFLRVCLFPDYRFSEDLDFDFLGTPVAFRHLIEKAAAVASEETQVSMAVEAAIRGPNLQILWGTGYQENKIKAEANFLPSATHCPPFQKHSLQPRWGGEKHSSIKILSYAPESVLADKVKCLARRSLARDLYDIYHLLNSSKIDKTRAFKLYTETWNDEQREYGWRNDPSEIRGSYLGRRARIEADWNDLSELAPVISDASFEEVFKTVDKWLVKEIADWKKSLPYGELDRIKQENASKRQRPRR